VFNHCDLHKSLAAGQVLGGKLTGQVSYPTTIFIDATPNAVALLAQDKVPSDGGYTVTGSPKYLEAENGNTPLAIDLYPVTLMGVGSVTAFGDIESTTLENTRPIAVYTPWSLIENTMPRKVNVLIMNDGYFDILGIFATRLGFDALQIAGELPETIIIGVPPGTGPHENQRMYELTYSQCQGETCGQVSPPGAPTNGSAVYLDWVKEVVIPAVMGTSFPGFELNEAGIFGYSLGGLTAVFSQWYDPGFWQRAYGGSPSVWWNDGEIATWLTEKYSGDYTGPLPKSVVLTLGTRETVAVIMESQAPWGEQFNRVIAAFQEVPGLKANENLFAFTPTGGAHNIDQWSRVGAHALRSMYGPYFPQLNMLSEDAYSESSIVVPSPTVSHPQPTSIDDKSKCGDNNGINTAGAAAIGAVGMFAFMIVGGGVLMWIRRRRDSGKKDYESGSHNGEPTVALESPWRSEPGNALLNAGEFE